MSTTFGIRAAALPAWLDLQHALARLDRPTVCASDPDSFTDPDPADVEYLASLCTGCPVLALCDLFATANRERSGIWAGRSRVPTLGRRPANLRKEVSPCV